MASYEPASCGHDERVVQAAATARARARTSKALFPASVVFSTDLHSLGQYVQDGRAAVCLRRVVDFAEPLRSDLQFSPEEAENLDGLNFLAGQNMSSVANRKGHGGHHLGPRRGRRAQRGPRGGQAWTAHDLWLPGLLLGEGVRHLRLSAGGQPLRPARAWRATRRTCSPCWASPATRRRRQSLRQSFAERISARLQTPDGV